MLILFCFAEVGSRFRDPGGPYLYARTAFGPLIGFQVGWLRWLSALASFSANTILLVDYLAVLCPGVNEGGWKMFSVSAVILSITALNVIGVRRATVASNVLAISKLIPLVLFVAVGFFFVDPARLVIASLPSYGDMSTSVLLVVYAYMGFEALTVPASEMRDPQRSIPFALFTSMGFIVVLFVLIQMVCIGTLPQLAVSTRPLADASAVFFGTFGGYFISAGAVLSIAGHLNVNLLSISRLVFAMSEHRQLPIGLAAVHKRFRTPHRTILLTSGAMLALALTGTFIQLATISVITRIVVYASTCAALPVLRRRGDLPASYRLKFGTLISIAAVALCIWLLTGSTAREIWMTSIAAGVGLAIYLLRRPRPVLF